MRNAKAEEVDRVGQVPHRLCRSGLTGREGNISDAIKDLQKALAELRRTQEGKAAE